MTAVSISRDQSIWRSFLAALLGGLIAGAIAKFADESRIPGAGMIGTHFGVWIVSVTMIAAWSHASGRAVVSAVTFLLAMVTAYYVSQMLLFGFFSRRLFLAWAVVAVLLAPPFAALASHARGAGWRAAFAAAVPVGLLLSEAYRLRWQLGVNEDYPILFAFDVACAVALLLLLPKDRVQRLRVIPLMLIILYIAVVSFDRILSIVLGILQGGGRSS